MIHSLKSLFTVPPWIACLQITDQIFTGVNNLTSYPKQIIYTCLQEWSFVHIILFSLRWVELLQEINNLKKEAIFDMGALQLWII